ncbi:hypothetical protein [Leifsonia shinshuensis]
MQRVSESRPPRQYAADEAEALADFPTARAELHPTHRLHLAGHSWRSSSHDGETTWHWIDAAYKAGTEPTDRVVLWVRTWATDKASSTAPEGLRELATTHLRDIVLARTPPVFGDDVEILDAARQVDAAAAEAAVRAAAIGVDEPLRLAGMASYAGIKDGLAYTVVQDDQAVTDGLFVTMDELELVER